MPDAGHSQKNEPELSNTGSGKGGSELMDGGDDGLTLEGLSQRLESLERENAELRSKVDTMEGSGRRRDEATDLRGSGTSGGEVPAPRDSDPCLDGEAATEFEGLVSRRSLLSKAGAAAVAAVAAGTLLNMREARAHDLGGPINADNIRTHWIEALPHAASGRIAVWGSGLFGGVGGDSASVDHPGVLGRNSRISATKGGTGVLGEGSEIGVLGDGMGGGTGVLGKSVDGTGVLGESTRGTGVHGKGKNGVFGESSTPGNNGVWGQHTNQGAGVSGVGRVGVIGFSHEDGWIASWGRHTTNGYGVAGDSAQGVGVSGESTSGYGGQFNGGKAQLRIVPGGTRGKPTTGSHSKGEIYMDKAGTLFVCTEGGDSATWRRIQTAAT